MSFFKKMKDKLGIAGVSVQIEVPEQASIDAGTVEGKIILTTKSEQEIVSYTVKMMQESTTGRGNDKKTKKHELGTISKSESFTIHPGDTKEISFTLSFEAVKSSNESLKESGGALGTLGKLASMANNEQSSYFVHAEVDVKSAALDPDAKKDIDLV